MLLIGRFVIVCAVCLVVTGPSSAEVKITGGGEYKDHKGIPVRAYSTFPSIVHLADGTALCYDVASKDGGRTWGRYQKFGFPLGDATRPQRGVITALEDGTVLLVGRCTRKHESDPDIYVAEVYRSRNSFRGYTGPTRSLIHLPNVVPGTDEYGMPAAGPFFEQSIVELPNGDLLASMWGWFESDRTPSGYPDLWDKWQLKKSRTFLIRSKDKGRTWRYVATVASDPNVGPEGFRLPNLALLPDGELLCLMRNGDGKQPLWLSRAVGDFTKWEKPEKIDVSAGYGRLLALSDGTVLLAYGKPLYVMGSTDGGRTWDVKNRITIGTRTGMAFTGRLALAEVSPGKVVCVYNDTLDLHARVLSVETNPKRLSDKVLQGAKR
jgi:hypothetical protein